MLRVALLRGINVGGKHRVEMAELKMVVARLGFFEVVTYLQSGNVVFSGPEHDDDLLAAQLAVALKEEFAFDIPTVVRSGPEMQAVSSAHPFEPRARVAKELHVLFLSETPDPELVAGLDQCRGGVDVFEVRGREIYLYLERAARTRLTLPWFERALGVTGTVRNWDTVAALAALAS